MAIYHKYLKYHKDDIEKHGITPDEIKFLAELQKEMNTQDHISQADPRFWVIKGSEREYGIEDGYCDGVELFDVEGRVTVAENTEEAYRYISENLLGEIYSRELVDYWVSIEDDSLRIEWKEEGEEESVLLDGMNEIAEWLSDHGHDHNAINYRTIDKIYANTMFPTQKAAEEHLRANDYHYSADAHTYAMTAWRCPEMTKLWKIIQTVDWSKLCR